MFMMKTLPWNIHRASLYNKEERHHCYCMNQKDVMKVYIHQMELHKHFPDISFKSKPGRAQRGDNCAAIDLLFMEVSPQVMWISALVGLTGTSRDQLTSHTT